MTWRIGLLALLAACGPSGGEGEVCENRLDDDGNGLTDCADPACAATTCVEICDDGLDNNLDSAVDCADPQCDGRGCAEDCLDGRDNDRNGDRDCADATCADTCDQDGDGAFTVDGGGDDCNDADEAVFPDAEERCDGVDNNCNGLVDRDDPDILRSDVTLYHLDADGDSYGDPENAVWECEQPSGRVPDGSDCDDADPDANPDTTEICNGLDDNCDGLIDDQDPQVDLTGAVTYYRDADADGLGNALVSEIACNQPAGYAETSNDCDDTQSGVLGPTMWLYDGDGDGYGGGAPQGPFGCVPPGANYVPEYAGYDCDDALSAISPDATEICDDGVDSDCDGADCAEWREDFEDAALGMEWTTGGNLPWLVQSGVKYAGNYAAASGQITHSQNTWMEVTLDFPIGGTATFQHSGDTETNYDYLEFWVDGSLLLSRSGFWGWTQANHVITPGTHTLEWRYRKDGSVNTGADRVWVDNIVVIGGN